MLRSVKHLNDATLLVFSIRTGLVTVYYKSLALLGALALDIHLMRMAHVVYFIQTST